MSGESQLTATGWNRLTLVVYRYEPSTTNTEPFGGVASLKAFEEQMILYINVGSGSWLA
jgi:hypothetical protein